MFYEYTFGFKSLLVLTAVELAHFVGSPSKYVHLVVEHAGGVEITMLGWLALKKDF
jgi:hypothetical protein